jgi:hypothetical protein
MNRQTLAHSRLFLIASILSLVTLTNAFAQPTPAVSSVRLSRFGDLLREHNIELTQPALIRALKNPDPEVRFLAAMKLSEEKAVDAIPEVKEALTTEEVPRTRVNIAVALGLLCDPGGPDELTGLCADQNFPPEFRLYAVRYMFDLHVENDTQCLQAAEQIVQTVDADYHIPLIGAWPWGCCHSFVASRPKNRKKSSSWWFSASMIPNRMSVWQPAGRWSILGIGRLSPTSKLQLQERGIKLSAPCSKRT